jgi:hypothetical protein
MTASRARGDGAQDPRRKLGKGQHLRRRLLGTDAIYRVVGENAGGVEVEVVDVQGLRAGSRFTFSRIDVLAMDVVDPPD